MENNLSKILNNDHEKIYIYNNKPKLRVLTSSPQPDYSIKNTYLNTSTFSPLSSPMEFQNDKLLYNFLNINNNNNKIQQPQYSNNSTNNSNNNTPTKVPSNLFLNNNFNNNSTTTPTTPLTSLNDSGEPVLKKFKPDYKPDVNIKFLQFEFDQTPLFIASFHNNTQSLKNMILCGVDLNHQCRKKGWSPLMYASQENNFEIVNQILSNGSTKIDATNIDGNSALYIACLNLNFKIVLKLLEKGSNVNIQNKQGCTPLMISCSIGNLEIIKLLLSHGALINQIDNIGFNCLMYCLIYGYNLSNYNNAATNSVTSADNSDENKIKCINYLIENGCKTDQISKDEWSPLKLAIKHCNNESAIKPLLYSSSSFSSGCTIINNKECSDSQGWTPIKIALRYSPLSIIEFIFSTFNSQIFDDGDIIDQKNNILDYFKLVIQFRSIDIFLFVYNYFFNHNNSNLKCILNKDDINLLISISTQFSNIEDSLKIQDYLNKYLLQ